MLLKARQPSGMIDENRDLVSIHLRHFEKNWSVLCALLNIMNGVTIDGLWKIHASINFKECS